MYILIHIYIYIHFHIKICVYPFVWVPGTSAYMASCQARHFAELLDWPDVRKRCEAGDLTQALPVWLFQGIIDRAPSVEIAGMIDRAP